MRYKPMRFDPDYRPFVAPQSIYIVPLSNDPAQCRVLSPAGLERRLLDLLIQDRLELRCCGNRPAEALQRVRSQLERSCVRQSGRYATRMNQAIVVGTVLLVFGIVNLLRQIPPPLADEIPLIAGGTAIGVLGYIGRRRHLPLLREKGRRAVGRLDNLECREEVLLTRIGEAIAARSTPEPGRDLLADPVEQESRWLVEHLDLQQLLENGEVRVKDLANLLEVLNHAFPLRRFLFLERKLRRDPGNRRARSLRETLLRRHGLSADAFTVYAEFYRLAEEVLSGAGP